MTTTASPATPARVRLTGQQRLVLGLLLGAGFMLSVDFSILNVALPETGAGVGLGTEDLPWVTSAYALPAAGLTLLFGRLADLFGRRRLFVTGLVLLAGASLLGGLAAEPGTLLAARALQGLATAMTIPAALSLITTTFAEGPVRDRVLGLNGALLSAGFTVGALVGGTLVSLLSWRAAFLVNVPVAVVLVLLSLRHLPASRAARSTPLDVPGAVAVSAGLVALVHGFVEASGASLLLGGCLLVAFWVIETRSAAPLAPVGILRRPTVTWGNVAGLVVFGTETAVIFLTTLYVQETLGLSPLATGLVFGVPGLAAVLAGPVAGRAIGRFGPRHVLGVGLAVQGLAMVPLVLVGDDRSAVGLVVPALFVGFFGHVASIVAFMVTATTGLPDDEQGLATGLASMTQQVAITIGTPILTAVAATQSDALAGMRLAVTVAAAAVVGTAALVWYGLRGRLPAGT